MYLDKGNHLILELLKLILRNYCEIYLRDKYVNHFIRKLLYINRTQTKVFLY